MKRITFTKACKVDPKYPKRLARPNYLGYLFTHPTHPGREFVVARCSKTTNAAGTTYRTTAYWALHDRKTGLGINTKDNAKTMTARAESALAWLSVITPEALAAHIEKCQVRRFRAIITKL